MRAAGFLAPLLFISLVNFQCACASIYLDDASTTRKGRFSAEFYLDYCHDEENAYNPETESYDLDIAKETYLSLDLSYGLFDNCDITLTAPYEFLNASYGEERKKADGFSDVYLSAKYRFWDEGTALPSFAVTFDFKSDSGNDNKDLGTGKKDYGINAILTKNIGRDSFDLNLGYIFVGGKAGDLLFYGTDWSREILRNTLLCLELYGEHNFEGKPSIKVFCAAAGISYRLTQMLNIESGIGIGLTRASPDYQFSGSVTFDF